MEQRLDNGPYPKGAQDRARAEGLGRPAVKDREALEAELAGLHSSFARYRTGELAHLEDREKVTWKMVKLWLKRIEEVRRQLE